MDRKEERMRMRKQFGWKTRRLWILLFIAALISFLSVFIPTFFIRPFRLQIPWEVSTSYALKKSAPWISWLCLVAVFASSIALWKRSRWIGKICVSITCVLAVSFTWFSHQNHYEWMFSPLPDPRFVHAHEVDFLEDSDMVLAVTVGRDSAAYPVRLLAYHHLVEDIVGNVPLVATY